MKLAQMIRNLWIYRKVILLAVLLGIALSFVLSNRDPIEVTFPLLGRFQSTSGVVMLMSASLGAAVCWLIMTVRTAWTVARGQRTSGEPIERSRSDSASGPTPGAPPASRP